MLSETMEKAFNEQLNKELYSSYLYYSMAAYFDGAGLGGFASWMRSQTQEEAFHAHKFYAYILERGGKVTLAGIEAPKVDWKTPLEVFEDTLEHEQFVTKSINDLMSLAQKENDNAAVIFLQWFVSEQVEEEDSVGDVLNKLRMVGDGGGLYMLDRELAKRVFVNPLAPATPA